MIIGFVNDKDLTSILPFFPEDALYYFTRASVPRALDENVLQAKSAADSRIERRMLS
jgi:dihydrofolate synthase / folylpolyglutamate synthase